MSAGAWTSARMENGLGVDRPSSTRWRRTCGSDAEAQWQAMSLEEQRRADRGRAAGAFAAAAGRTSMPGWKRNRRRSCPRARLAERWTTRSRTGRPCRCYPNDGWLDIDNNEGENSLRGLCLGRKNWLFFAEAIVAAERRRSISACWPPASGTATIRWMYFRDVLTRLPAVLPGASEEELLAFLPHRWQPA